MHLLGSSLIQTNIDYKFVEENVFKFTAQRYRVLSDLSMPKLCHSSCSLYLAEWCDLNHNSSKNKSQPQESLNFFKIYFVTLKLHSLSCFNFITLNKLKPVLLQGNYGSAQNSIVVFLSFCHPLAKHNEQKYQNEPVPVIMHPTYHNTYVSAVQWLKSCQYWKLIAKLSFLSL